MPKRTLLIALMAALSITPLHAKKAAKPAEKPVPTRSAEDNAKMDEAWAEGKKLWADKKEQAKDVYQRAEKFTNEKELKAVIKGFADFQAGRAENGEGLKKMREYNIAMTELARMGPELAPPFKYDPYDACRDMTLQANLYWMALSDGQQGKPLKEKRANFAKARQSCKAAIDHEPKREDYDHVLLQVL